MKQKINRNVEILRQIFNGNDIHGLGGNNNVHGVDKIHKTKYNTKNSTVNENIVDKNDSVTVSKESELYSKLINGFSNLKNSEKISVLYTILILLLRKHKFIENSTESDIEEVIPQDILIRYPAIVTEIFNFLKRLKILRKSKSARKYKNFEDFNESFLTNLSDWLSELFIGDPCKNCKTFQEYLEYVSKHLKDFNLSNSLRRNNMIKSAWLIDKRGNRITDEQAAEIVRRNRSEIEDLENRMNGRSKADNLGDGSWLRWHDLKVENDYYESILKHIEYTEGRKIMNNRQIKSGYERNAESIKKIFSSVTEADVEKYILDDYSFGFWGAPDIKSDEELSRRFDAELDTGDYIAAYLSAKENGVDISSKNEEFFQECLEYAKPENNWYLKIHDEYIKHHYENATHGDVGGKHLPDLEKELNNLKQEFDSTEPWKENKIIRLQYNIDEKKAEIKGYQKYLDNKPAPHNRYHDDYADLYWQGKAPEHYNRYMAKLKARYPGSF